MNFKIIQQIKTAQFSSKKISQKMQKQNYAKQQKNIISCKKCQCFWGYSKIITESPLSNKLQISSRTNLNLQLSENIAISTEKTTKDCAFKEITCQVCRAKVGKYYITMNQQLYKMGINIFNYYFLDKSAVSMQTLNEMKREQKQITQKSLEEKINEINTKNLIAKVSQTVQLFKIARKVVFILFYIDYAQSFLKRLPDKETLDCLIEKQKQRKILIQERIQLMKESYLRRNLQKLKDQKLFQNKRSQSSMEMTSNFKYIRQERFSDEIEIEEETEKFQQYHSIQPLQRVNSALKKLKKRVHKSNPNKIENLFPDMSYDKKMERLQKYRSQGQRVQLSPIKSQKVDPKSQSNLQKRLKNLHINKRFFNALHLNKLVNMITPEIRFPKYDKTHTSSKAFKSQNYSQDKIQENLISEFMASIKSVNQFSDISYQSPDLTLYNEKMNSKYDQKRDSPQRKSFVEQDSKQKQTHNLGRKRVVLMNKKLKPITCRPSVNKKHKAYFVIQQPRLDLQSIFSLNQQLIFSKQHQHLNQQHFEIIQSKQKQLTKFIQNMTLVDKLNLTRRGPKEKPNKFISFNRKHKKYVKQFLVDLQQLEILEKQSATRSFQLQLKKELLNTSKRNRKYKIKYKQKNQFMSKHL